MLKDVNLSMFKDENEVDQDPMIKYNLKGKENNGCHALDICHSNPS